MCWKKIIPGLFFFVFFLRFNNALFLFFYTANLSEPTLKLKSRKAESDTHASFESGFRHNSIVQNNNYSFFFLNNYQNTPSFLAPL